MKLVRGIRAKEAAIAALLLALIVAIQLLGNSNAPQTDTYAVTDYRSGGYAAFFALMQREGVAVETFERRPAELDHRIDTLVAATPPGGFNQNVRTAADEAALTAWVAGGGRVVVLSERYPQMKPVRIVGRGEIVRYAQPQRFTNGAIAKNGNARLAYDLAKPLHSGGVVAFDEAIHGLVIDRPWWQVLSTGQRVALGGCALAIVIALAGGLLRLGPAVSVRAMREPASDEFVAAAASLYQRSGARAAALALLAHGARNAHGPAAMQLRELAERPAPDDRDLIAGAKLARIVREGN